jgi:hypothetical protein
MLEGAVVRNASNDLRRARDERLSLLEVGTDEAEQHRAAWAAFVLRRLEGFEQRWS